MTAKEMAQVLGVIRANLPGVFLNQTPEDARFMATEWAQHFASADPEIVLAAARTYCYRAEDRKNFPTPGNIRAIYEELQRCVGYIAGGVLSLDANVPAGVSSLLYQRGTQQYEKRYHKRHPRFVINELAARLGGSTDGEQKRLS